VIQCYEVTIKSFGEQRVEECTESIIEYNTRNSTKISEVIVLCRLEDRHPAAIKEAELGILLGSYLHGGINYLFIDLYEWIFTRLIQMSLAGRLHFLKSLAEYVQHPNTAEAVKKYWKDFHEKKVKLDID
jgi:hypothetical protein